jgi:hypothetical protein
MDGGELDGLSQSAQSRILSSKTDRILDETFVARPLSYIRVHLWPKRFPLFHSVSWQSRVVAVGAEYVVVNKPSGVPVPPTVDNVLECVQTGAAQALGVDVETLHVTSRIDQPTEGLVVVGRSKAFVGRFNAAVRGDGTGGTTKKFYRAAAWVDDDVVRSPPWSEHMDVRHRVLVKHKAPMTPFVTLVCDSGPREKLVDCHMVIVSARALADGEQRHARGPRRRNTPCVPDGREPAGRRTVLHGRNVLYRFQARLAPAHKLRHVALTDWQRIFSCRVPRDQAVPRAAARSRSRTGYVRTIYRCDGLTAPWENTSKARDRVARS